MEKAFGIIIYARELKDFNAKIIADIFEEGLKLFQHPKLSFDVIKMIKKKEDGNTNK